MTRIIFKANPPNYSLTPRKAMSTNDNRSACPWQKIVDDMFSETVLSEEEQDRKTEERIRKFQKRHAVQSLKDDKKPLTVKERVLNKTLALLSLVKKVPEGQPPEESDAQKRVNALQEKLNNYLDREACGLIDQVPESLYDALAEAEKAVAQERKVVTPPYKTQEYSPWIPLFSGPTLKMVYPKTRPTIRRKKCKIHP